MAKGKPLIQNQKVEGSNNITAGGDIIISSEAVERLQSTLVDVIPKLNALIEAETIPLAPPTTGSAYKIEDKISHNNLIGYKHWIEEYGQYGATVDGAYKALDDERPGAYSKVIRSFKARYDRLKGDVLSKNAAAIKSGTDPMDLIRQHADQIIADVASEVKRDLADGDPTKVKTDDLDFCSIAMTCHAFINCKILERPANVG